jgi:hypothetical protein
MREFRPRPRAVARRLAPALAVALTALSASTAGAEAAPVVTSVDPSSVLVGDFIIASGTGLIGASAVTVDGTSVQFDDYGDNSVAFLAPEHPVGKADVQVTVGGVTSTTAGTGNDLTYLAPPVPPVITSVAPATGKPGTTIVVKGTGFSKGFFGVIIGAGDDDPDGVLVNKPVVDSDTQLHFTAPPHPDGRVDILIITSDAASDVSGTADDFTYVTPPPAPLLPRITQVTPNIGLAGFGGPITVTGVNFKDVRGLRVGPKSLKFIQYGNTLAAAVPPQPKGNYPVTVITAAGFSPVSNVATYKYFGF